MKISCILLMSVFVVGCVHRPKPTPVVAAVQPESPEATDAELAGVRAQIPSLHADMKISEVFEHLGVSRLLHRVRWMGGGPSDHYWMHFYLRLNHTPLTVTVDPSGRVIGVRFEEFTWKQA